MTTIWLDAHLSPDVARWIGERFGLNAEPIERAGLQSAKDRVIFDAARRADAIIMTKDSDFVELVERLGPPPRVIHLTFGNSSNAELRRVLERSLPGALEHLASGERHVEIAAE